MDNVEIPKWLKGLPLAPEFRPTDTEFADPIAYISKIEKEASAFGICKVIPPLPKPSKKYVFGNLNKSLSKCPELGSDAKFYSISTPKVSSVDGTDEGEVRAVFTTRHQELGQSVKRTKGTGQCSTSVVHKQVWQSGEVYTLDQFESKSRIFARSLLGALKEVSPLVTEALFWKAASEKPIYIEYANDVPGSAFGEPEGQSHHFRRRRRKRNFYRRSREGSSTKKDDIISDNMKNMHNVDVKDTSSDGGLITHSGTSKLSSTPAYLYSDETSQSSKKMSRSSFCDTEGSAGWKLSNSPWNLQVIARSPGSLTRFMPDDIPGVTSPMVYVGMLFSWFAWHVEDHELHSMNFLHTGSSKTWYAVPGDYAFEFEEIVRSKAYGGNMDRLAALTMLGEKTTLVSPDVVVASGIPCFRLIQNPGEFVVTFPRAYHVGFSHGFNCGEAANFATPQWLKVAKEAAVRRAAMNYLPMLSHQQLLYLLTMSFVSRIPRSLLPGVRSSRLRDRQKEEREFLVKKAFIEDILIENNTLSVLVGKDTSYHAVFWNADSLLCPNKEPLSPSAAANVTAVSTENVSLIHPDPYNNDINYRNDNNLLSDDIELYLENLTDLYMDSDDLSCDFQIHSGTLACVACGILGYPFMSVVQPSEKASLNLLSDNYCLAEESQGASTLRKPSGCDIVAENVPPVSSSQPAMDFPVPSATKFDNGWNTSDRFLRPRSFCLTHAVEIVELLRHKGGAKVLVICHSDYQRIKAHAAFIAEEVDSLFNYNEIPMDFASKEDLNLIDLAIDDEEKDGLGKDWTSKLGINLRHCVRIRKNSPSKQVQHALTLSGLFSDRIHSDLFTVKWLSRKYRTKKNSHPTHCKPCESAKLKKDEVVGESKDRTVKNEKLIQYSRRSYRRKPSGSTEADQTGSICRQPTLPWLDAHNRQVSESNFCQIMKFAGKSADFVFSALNGRSETRQINMLEATGDSCFEAHIDDHLSKEINMDGIVELEGPVVQDKTEVNEVYCEGKPESPNVHATDESCHIVSEKQIVGLFNMIIGLPDAASKGLPILADEAVVMGEVTSQITTDLPEGSFVKPTKEVIEEHCLNDENCDPLALDNEVQQEMHCGDRNNDKDPVSYCPTLKNGCSSALKNECHEDSTESLAARVSSDTTYLNSLLKPEIKTREESNEEAKQRYVPSVSKPSLVSMEGSFEIPKGHCSRAELCHDQTSKELVPSTVMNVELNHPCASYSEASIRSSVENDLGCVVMTLEPANEVDMLMTNVTIEQEPVAQVENQTKSFSVKDLKGFESPSDKDLSHDRSRSTEDLGDISKVCSLVDESDRGNAECTVVYPMSDAGKGRKRKREVEQITENNFSCNGFIKSPCEGLRPRSCKDATGRSEIDIREEIKQTPMEKVKKPSNVSVSAKAKNENLKKSYKCDLEGCRMSFVTKSELTLHKRNLCPYEGCGKRFSSHKYARIHHRVHDDDRPLKCPWKGCSMSFKWAWARTEHIRVHTGERPYQCKVESCGLCFRFVSDFSRHRRKTGHYVN